MFVMISFFFKKKKTKKNHVSGKHMYLILFKVQ